MIKIETLYVKWLRTQKMKSNPVMYRKPLFCFLKVATCKRNFS